MDLNWLEALFRWSHVVAGILWIGHLYFFNFVNSQVAKTYDADSRKKVIPELMPRALYWFRWGAVYTWATGFLLTAFVYYMMDNLVRKDIVTDAPAIPSGLAVAISIALIVVIFFLYEVIWRAFGKNEKAGVTVSYLLFVALLFGLSRIFTPRAVFIHTGVLFGTIMVMNVWMRIWPAQRKIIQGVKGVAPAPDPSVAAMSTLRSKHNTYLSVPLVFAMISNHYPTIYGWEHSWILMAVVILLGWLVTKRLYSKSGTAAPAQFGSPAPTSPSGTPSMAAPKA